MPRGIFPNGNRGLLKRGNQLNKGRIPNKETREKMSNIKKGIKLSEEHKRKIRESNVGRIYKRGWKLSEETRKKMGESRRGSKCYLWKGGISPINKIIRMSLEYRLWRTAVFERDNYTCIWCGIKSGNGRTVILNADHIKPFALYPELRFAIDNGRTLCRECHKKTNTYAGRTK